MPRFIWLPSALTFIVSVTVIVESLWTMMRLSDDNICSEAEEAGKNRKVKTDRRRNNNAEKYLCWNLSLLNTSPIIVLPWGFAFRWRILSRKIPPYRNCRSRRQGCWEKSARGYYNRGPRRCNISSPSAAGLLSRRGSCAGRENSDWP